MLIRHLKRKQKIYEYAWWMYLGFSLVGVAMTAITVYFETRKGLASNMLYPSLAIVLIGVLLIAITGQMLDRKEEEIEERLERIDTWYERTSNG